MRKAIPKKIQSQIFIRDKWCCRYCGVEVFFSPALKALDSLSPNNGYYHRNGRKDKMSSHLLNRCAAIDHITPVTLGGTNNIDNLICACWECNSAKSNEEPKKWMNKIIPIEKINMAEGWDGFLGILKQIQPENEWLKYFI